MFISRDDLNKKLYDEVIDAITRSDPTREERGIETAVEIVRAYLAGRYDTDKLFEARGVDRNFIIVKICADIALYEIADILEVMPVTILNPYEKSMELLKDLQAGKATLVGVPEPIDPETNQPDSYIKYGQSDFNRY